MFEYLHEPSSITLFYPHIGKYAVFYSPRLRDDLAILHLLALTHRFTDTRHEPFVSHVLFSFFVLVILWLFSWPRSFSPEFQLPFYYII